MKTASFFAALALAIIILATSQTASAITADNLKNMKVIGHHFTTYFSNGNRKFSIKDTSKARIIVIKLAVGVPSDDSKLFANDFMLQYLHRDGKEDRARCDAICRAKTPELSEDDGCATSWVKLDKTNRYITLVFALENDVDKVNIGRAGTAPVSYQLGSDRPFSVFIATNKGKATLAKVEKAIRAGGYQITRGITSLAKRISGITIHYAAKAEVQGREISQRIMTEMGITPVVKKMKLISDNDIVIWIGK